MSSQSGRLISRHKSNTTMEAYNVCSDGIARVHGMNNVQAEELVEYVHTLRLRAT